MGIATGLGYSLFWDGFSQGQSLGKKLLGIRVIDFKTGAPCRYGQSFTRNSSSSLGAFDWAGVFTSSRRRPGDHSANTVVVRAVAPPAGPRAM
ncbi:MAG TPA: RDD family protein [Candidatus Eisenbacteria bacterium]